MGRIDFNNLFMKIAILVSNRSSCISKQVGAVLVKNNRILSIGYNGVPPKQKHCNEIFNKERFNRKKHHEFSIKNELHAEQNIIAYCAKNGIKINNTTLYITLSPCRQCAKLLISSGVKEIYYKEKYDLDDSIKYLKNNNIKIKQI